MRKNRIIKLAALCLPLFLASCGTKQAAMNTANAQHPMAVSKNNGHTGRTTQDDAIQKLTFIQKVSDNQVYNKNITGNMSFGIQTEGKSISVPGSLHMRKDEVIRIQLFIPLLGTEIGRLEFTPTYVLIVDRLHKEYIKADYTQVDFLKKQGITFYSLQALFWNQLLLPGVQKVTESDLKKFDANLDVEGEQVPVSFRNGDMNYIWTAERATGRINQADVIYQSSHEGTSSLNVKYSDFRSVGVKMFPATQILTFTTDALQKKREVVLNIEMNDVKTDGNWDVQTEVSSKYKQVSPEDVLGKIMNF